MPPIKPILDSKSATQTDLATAAKTRLEIIEQRRFAWRLNYRMLWISVAVLGLFMVACIVSYRHNSNKTADTFLSMAEQAAADGRYAEQATWLHRYSMLRPNDIDAIVNTAMAADSAADSAELELRPRAVNEARKYLSDAIGRLGGEQHLEKKTEIRKLLINRLLQIGEMWFGEAESQVIQLNSHKDDPQANKWMALALVGQVQSDYYGERSSNKESDNSGDRPSDEESDNSGDRASDEESESAEYWTDLSNRKPGEVLLIAINKNPTDVYLLENLVLLFAEHPDQFDQESGDEQPPVESLEKRVENRLAKIKTNSDSRSYMIRYGFDKERYRSDENRFAWALDTLTDVAEQAESRLKELSAADSENESTKGSFVPFVVGEAPAGLMDFSLLAEVAFQVGDNNPERARRYFDFLISVRPVGVTESLREKIYLLSGRLAFAQGKRLKAIDIWKRGLEDANPNSIVLHHAIASLLVESVGPLTEQSADESANDETEAAVKRAEDAVDRFSKSVEMARRRLAATKVRDMVKSARAALARNIETAEWQKNILDAKLIARSGETLTAIDLLESALNSQAKIEDTERIEAARLLAWLHQQSGAWDSVAMVLEKAVALALGNESLREQGESLRAQLAVAWDRAGNHARAWKQWKILGNSDSIVIKVASIEAQFRRQLRELPEGQDFGALRSAVSSVREKVNQGLSIDLKENERIGLQQAISQLDRLEITFPPSGHSFNQYLDSPEMAEAIAKLAETHPADVKIQEFAGKRLAVAGDIDQSDEALARLEKLLGESSTPVVIIRADVYAAQDKFVEAYQILLEQAIKDPSQSKILRRRAASNAIRVGDVELAYQALEKIQEPSLATLFTLSRIAGQLPTNSKIVQKLSASELSEQWKSRLKLKEREGLKEGEGDEGTYWRYLDAVDLIQQIRKDPPELTHDKLAIARSLVRELLSIRPQWGEAISLEGWLSAIDGKHDHAIEQLRNGMASGDRQVSTRQLLLELLLASARDEEVKEVLAQPLMGQPVDKNSAIQIRLAIQQGDFKGSLDHARDAAKERPNDFIANILLAKVAIIAAQKAATAEDRNERFIEAQDAISKAEEVSEGDKFAVFDTALSLRLAMGDPVAVRQQIERIEASQLDEFVRLRLMSRGLEAIKEYKEALSLLLRADKLRQSSQTQLDLARVYRQLNQPNQEIDALRKAQQLDSKNAELRNRLAQALVTREGNDVNWSEIKDLLQGTGDATEKNRLQYAILLGARGDEKQLDQAEVILNDVIDERNSNSNDARRILAMLLRKRIDRNSSANPLDENSLKQVEDIRSLYDYLRRLPQPEAADLYRYADFLLIHGQTDDDLDQAARLRDKLNRSEGWTKADLEIGVRHAEKTMRSDEIPQIVREWADDETEDGSLEKDVAFAIAAGSLLKSGFVDEGLQWMEKAYREEPKMLARYVVALNQADRQNIALAICTEHHQKHDDIESLILLAETVLNSPPEIVTRQHRDLLDNAVREKIKNPQPEDAQLLEGVATWRMQQQKYKQAVALYHEIDKLAPQRIRTLNNWAMAYSEIPGLESDGIKPIKRALELARNNPALLAELLDTYGVVLLRSGSLGEAEKVFRSAILKKPTEPRFQFHLILTLAMQNKDSDAKDLWSRLDVEKLDPKGLTPRERKEFEKMKSENLINQSGNEGQITQ